MSPTEATPPSFDLVVEWENARLSELARARLMLQRVDEQVSALACKQKPTMWIVYESDEIDPAVINDAVQSSLAPPDQRAVNIQLRGTCGKGYYELKNFGASLCRSDVIVFIDSDVIPEDNWLALLLSTFDDPSAEVVGGTAYIDPVSLYSKSFALFWFFPLRDEGTGIRRSRSFFANNVAFRRSTFASHHYPELPNFRGQCGALAKLLQSEGTSILTRVDARVSHPPPNGPKHFILRALAHGHDDVVDARRLGSEDRRGAVHWLNMLRRRARTSAQEIVVHRGKLGMTAAQSAVAFVLAVTFHTIRCVGAVYCCFKQDGLRRVVRV